MSNYFLQRSRGQSQPAGGWALDSFAVFKKITTDVLVSNV